jgi:tripartite-type tricarboxylate transporter receptor subunit TctC
LPELLVGNVDLLFDSIAATLPHIKAGRLRAIAVAGSNRSPALRELPTVAEAGIRRFGADQWYGILAPEGVHGCAGSSDDSGRQHRRCRGACCLRHRAGKQLPGELAKIIHGEVVKWAKVIRDAGIKPE